MWRGGTAPFPITFTVGEARREAELGWVYVGFNGMGDDELAGLVGAGRIVEEFLDWFGAVFVTEFHDTSVDSHGEFTVENYGAVFTVDVDVVFTKAGVDEVDDVFEVFVDEEGRGAENNEVEVIHRGGIVKVGFSEDEVEKAFDFGEPETLW